MNNNTFSSLAAFAFMIQVACVYFFSALQKSSPEWWKEGTAIYYALSLDQLVFPLGKWLLPHFEVTKVLTRVVYVSELLLPVLYFIPFKNPPLRFFACISLCIFHLAINLLLFVGLFSVIGIAVNLAMLPSFVFDRKVAMPLPVANIGLPGKIRDWILGVLILYVMIWNVGNTPYSSYTMNGTMRIPGYFLRLDQNWGMFAPSVFKNDGWYVMNAKTINGDSIDLYRDGTTVHYNKPTNVLSEIKNDRWRKFNEQVLLQSWCRKDYCRYVLDEWNKKHPEQRCESMKLIYVSERTKPYPEDATPVPVILFTFNNTQ